MPAAAPENRSPRRLAIEVRGVVQGVGFRPFVYHAARQHGLIGWVQNRTGAVYIEVEGPADALEAFLDALRHFPPPQARIDSLRVDAAEASEAGDHGAAASDFTILPSEDDAAPRPNVPADLAVCGDCLAEIHDPHQRRHHYPFTNCTNCGPRWSIITGLPYDRPLTSMADFAMCDACRREYDDPADRRFHAQPIACPRCGPHVTLEEFDGQVLAEGEQAIDRAAAAVLRGEILALMGMGGFQLVVDATSAAAVDRLRERKHRPHKPLAVMLPSLDAARRCCEIFPQEAEALTSAAAPILLLRRRSGGHGNRVAAEAGQIVEQVAPGNPYLGAMLPYSPLHVLLIERIGRPVVCTSGNLSEEPMAVDADDARRRLGGIADVMLTHNRRIVRPVDDSVARVVDGGVQILRRARGYAPLPLDLGFAGPTVLALGGHLKNTVALSLGSQVIVGPHVGDLEHPLSIDVHRRAAADLVDFFRVRPDVVACDLHPDYASTRHGEELAARWNVPLVRVQHHHAHVAACMVENDLEDPVLGLAWDGTGYGPDGTIWGGEALVCEGAVMTRVAHLRTFPLPGGDRAIRHPRRSALGLLAELFGAEQARRLVRQPPLASQFAGIGDGELTALLTMAGRGVQTPRTSSMGRLFDGIAAIAGWSGAISFEGQAALQLEFAIEETETAAYPLPLTDALPALLDWAPLVAAVLDDLRSQRPAGIIAARFHNALAEAAAAVARRFPHGRVALTGGCFQNLALTRRVRERLKNAGHKVYLHHVVPPGDGGIALGQVMVAARSMEGSLHVSRHTG